MSVVPLGDCLCVGENCVVETRVVETRGSCIARGEGRFCGLVLVFHGGPHFMDASGAVPRWLKVTIARALVDGARR